MLALAIRISLLLGGVTFLLFMLPASQGLPPEIADALSYVVGLARSFDWLLPINTAVHILGLAVKFYLGVFLFVSLRWLLHLISNTSAGA